jgi:hypothetical protein
MVTIIGERVWRNVQLVYKHFTIFDLGIGIFEVCAPLPQGLHFGALEDQSGLVFIDNKIIPPGFAVLGDYFDVSFFQNSCISFLI